MDVNAEYVATLLNMGFPSEVDIRKALRLGKNDLNQAVAYLTDDHPSCNYDNRVDIDVDVKVQQPGPSGSNSPAHEVTYGPYLPPSYDEAVQTEVNGTETQVEDMCVCPPTEDASLEFPVTNLYELEGRVFTESWSIPYRREESLGKCLLSAIRLADAGLSDSDENCKRFIDRCMPEAFTKLLTAGAVHRWGPEIQEGIYSMLTLLIDLIIARLKHMPVPVELLDMLTLAFRPDCEYHYKNKGRRTDRVSKDEATDSDNAYAVCAAGGTYSWLVNLINRFCQKGGLEQVKNLLESNELDAPILAALLSPFGICSEVLNPTVMGEALSAGIANATKYVETLEENDFKEKKVGSVCDLLGSLKLLQNRFHPDSMEDIDDLRLSIALRMLQSPHFNAKMNSLKEVTRQIDDISGTKKSKTAIESEKILTWMVDKQVLSIALEGNIDQAQYCDKIKGIVDFLGSQLSLDDLSMIWKIQNGKTNNVIDNIHSIVAAAAVKFDPQQLEHLFLLISDNWQEDNDRMREKLLKLIGKIGRDARVPKTTTRVLELLWDLAHLPAQTTKLIEQALGEHLAILSDSYIVKEQLKKQYVVKCIEDIKKGVWVLPAIKQLLHISKNILKQSMHKTDKGILHDLNKMHDLIKLITNSLIKCHKVTAVASSGKMVSPDTVVDGRYTHSEYVSTHLAFLQYLLQEGVLYLPSGRARDIWSTLVASPESCDWDKETCYEWFSKGLSDLETETQSQLFQKELLKIDPAKLSEQGFSCVKCFFECVNLYDHKLKKSGNNTFIVEKTDLCGLDYLWEVCLNTADENIANTGITILLNMSYTYLAPRLKKDPVAVHKKFITECYNRLEAALVSIGGSAIAQIITNATKMLTSATVPEVSLVLSPSRSSKLQNIERLLWIAERYILSVEGMHITPRIILPHGASFHGHPISLSVNCESTKQEFTIFCHNNESLLSLREKVARHLKQTPENVQIVANEKVLSIGKDQKLLHQLDLEDNQMILVRIFSPAATTTTSLQSSTVREPPSTPTSKQSFDLEQEKMLPGVVMATGGQVFEKLYQLADLDEPKITARVRNLLMLIPTDPAISDALDSLIHRHLKPSLSGDELSPRSSPKKSQPSPAASPRLSPKEILRGLFDANAADMSAFRLLYNLEVLSSKLMPAMNDIVTQQSANTFCEEFLLAGGLNLIVNVLQKEAIPMDVDYMTRQGCYAICLQLARFLLCGQTVTGDDVHKARVSREPSLDELPLPSTPASGHHFKFDLTTPTAGCRAIQTMGVNEFTEIVSCFMRVTWAAAAGRLHLVGSAQPVRESNSWYSGGRRSRQSSTGSTGSGSDNEGQSLHAGVCIQQSTNSSTDTHIAKEALELLVTCLQLRSQLIASFYSLPCVSDFIIDLLVGSSHAEIRSAALDQFYILSQTEIIVNGSPPNTSPASLQNSDPSPHDFLLQVLLKAYLPFWVASTTTRGASQRLLNQCPQYFELRCKLLENLCASDQNKLSIDPASMLEDEIAWLSNFCPSENLDLKEIDSILLAGHLKLMRTLLTCDGISKEDFGETLVPDLLDQYLFPAAKIITENLVQSKHEISLNDFNPKCANTESRTAAYDLLVELSNNSPCNLNLICKQLISRHHQPNPDIANEWEYMPPVDGRALCGFVGLKNAGATCYMNSVIQQLFMTPGIAEAVLATEDHCSDDETVFYQVQQMFGHLMESKLQYHIPEKFWQVFKLWGQTVNLREQQDAFDFFQALVDQIDEYMKHNGKDMVFVKKFQGIFSDQKNCKDCPHRYEREETFLALNLTVKNATLQDSLDQFVKDELLEGDNAYFCEKCGEKRNTVKRTCIKTLPPVLCIQLKRFGYDWENNRALKFDDHFKFPWVLNMEPYTAEGLARQEVDCENENINNNSSTYDGELVDKFDQENDFTVTAVDVTSEGVPTYRPINYELVGIVVHNGQANAGHYYSFIKDRRGSVIDNPQRGRWFKFNDTIVEEFDMNDNSLEVECFGGTYNAKVFEQSSSYPEERLRYWNGYMLFYERLEDPHTPVAKRTRLSGRRKPFIQSGKPRLDSDSLVELTELVHKGEKRGIFTDRMPASIQQIIRAENITFIKNRDIYNQDYFRFVCLLVSRNSFHRGHASFQPMSVQSMHLAISFLFNTFLRTKKKLRNDMDDWVNVIDKLLSESKEACRWLVDYLASEQGVTYIKPFLLECPHKDVRYTFAKLIERMIVNYFFHGGVATQKTFDAILETLIQMLNKDVPENSKHCVQYFLLLKLYVQIGTKACTHMLGRNGFQRLMMFLVGHPVTNTDQMCRRWSSIQARDFGHLHSALATLILNCEVASYRTEDSSDYLIPKPLSVSPHIYLKMSIGMQNYVFGNDSQQYISEVVHAVREVSGSTQVVIEMLTYCSFCNAGFTNTLLKQVTLQFMNAPSSELRSLFTLLTDVLMLEDPLQLQRIRWVIEGQVDEKGVLYDGLLNIIRTNHVTDSRRTYQCIKFLVGLAVKCQLAKDYLLQTHNKWQWAIDWLKRKMTEFCWKPPPSVTVSNEDSNRKSFQRTVSAQDTLEEATALLTELEVQENAFSATVTIDMEMSQTSENGSENNDNSTEPLTKSGSLTDDPTGSGGNDGTNCDTSPSTSKLQNLNNPTCEEPVTVTSNPSTVR